jgi:hypothetical protein
MNNIIFVCSKCGNATNSLDNPKHCMRTFRSINKEELYERIREYFDDYSLSSEEIENRIKEDKINNCIFYSDMLFDEEFLNNHNIYEYELCKGKLLSLNKN